MNLSELRAAVLDDMNYSTSPGSTVTGRIDRWLNEAQRKLLRKPGLQSLRQRSLVFDSVADYKYAAMPAAFERVDIIRQVGNDRRVRFRSRDFIADADPGDRATGDPQYYAPGGLQPVIRHPSDTGVWAVSTSGSDTTQNVRMTGVRESGDIQSQATAQLTGTTRVAIGSLTDLVAITKNLSLDGVAVGDVEFYDASTGGNLLARIPAGALSIQYQTIRLWPTPSDALTYQVDGQIVIPTLSNDQDVPMLPQSYHDMLPVYARFRLYRKEGDAQRAAMEEREWATWMLDLDSYVEFPTDWEPRSGSLQENSQISTLGAWFPPDSGIL